MDIKLHSFRHSWSLIISFYHFSFKLMNLSSHQCTTTTVMLSHSLKRVCACLSAQASGQVLASERLAVCCRCSDVHLSSGVLGLSCVSLALSVIPSPNHCLTPSMTVTGFTETEVHPVLSHLHHMGSMCYYSP